MRMFAATPESPAVSSSSSATTTPRQASQPAAKIAKTGGSAAEDVMPVFKQWYTVGIFNEASAPVTQYMIPTSPSISLDSEGNSSQVCTVH